MRRRLVEASEGALQAGLSREAVVRRIQRGDVDGERKGGRWYVELHSLLEAVGRTEAAHG